MRRIAVVISILLSFQALGARRVFLKEVYGQLHQNASKFSRILTTFECGQPFKVLKDANRDFYQVSYATYKGFIAKNLVSTKKPRACWQDKYRKFFENLDLGVSDMHYWGLLQDMYIEGKVLP